MSNPKTSFSSDKPKSYQHLHHLLQTLYFRAFTPVFPPFPFSAHIPYIQAFISPAERWKKTKSKSPK